MLSEFEACPDLRHGPNPRVPMIKILLEPGYGLITANAAARFT